MDSFPIYRYSLLFLASGLAFVGIQNLLTASIPGKRKHHLPFAFFALLMSTQNWIWVVRFTIADPMISLRLNHLQWSANLLSLIPMLFFFAGFLGISLTKWDKLSVLSILVLLLVHSVDDTGFAYHGMSSVVHTKLPWGEWRYVLQISTSPTYFFFLGVFLFIMLRWTWLGLKQWRQTKSESMQTMSKRGLVLALGQIVNLVFVVHDILTDMLGHSVYLHTYSLMCFVAIMDVYTTIELSKAARMKDQLQESQSRLQSSLKDLELRSMEQESIIFAASHDLRTPLVNLSGFSHEVVATADEIRRMVQDNPQRPHGTDRMTMERLVDRLRHEIGYIQESTSRLGRLLDGLLEVSRLGRESMELQEIDPVDALEEAWVMNAKRIADVGMRLQKDEVIPSCLADRRMLVRVFTEIIRNAIEHVVAMRKPVLLVSAVCTHDRVILLLKDNGEGFDAQSSEKIFEMFHTLHHPDPRNPRKGIGLTIAKRLILRMNGIITSDSTPGVGTTIHLALPSVGSKGL